MVLSAPHMRLTVPTRVLGFCEVGESIATTKCAHATAGDRGEFIVSWAAAWAWECRWCRRRRDP